jgi:hypothetical protein
MGAITVARHPNSRSARCGADGREYRDDPLFKRAKVLPAPARTERRIVGGEAVKGAQAGPSRARAF